MIDNRGGRPQKLKMKDQDIEEKMQAHIDRFPTVESHFCRSST